MPYNELKPTPGGEFDFNPVFEEGEITVENRNPKRSRSIPEDKTDPREIDLLDFLPACQHSEGMQEFVLPFNNILNWFKEKADHLTDVVNYGRSPKQYLSLLAGNLSFPLIDMPFATDSERRQLIAEIVPILNRKGTLWSIQRICEILGFTVTLEEDYKVTGIYNVHGPGGPALQLESSYNWNDGTFQGWQNESMGNFKPIAGKLRGKGSSGATVNPLQSCNIADTKTNYHLVVCYNIISSGDVWIGVNIRWEDDLNLIRAHLFKAGAVEILGVVEYVNGIGNNLAFIDITGYDWQNGEHKLHIWDDGDKVTVILDDTTFIFEQSYTSTIQAIKKGLWVNETSIVDFDDFEIYNVDRRKQARFFSSGNYDKTLKITLTGSPQFENPKREYLSNILLDFVPIGTVLQIL